MDKDLTNLKGIGATAAASLSEAGFTTIDEVANATPESLGKVRGFGPSRDAKVIEAAKELSAGKDVDSESKPAVDTKPADSPEETKVIEKVEVKTENKPEEKVTAKPEVDLDKLAYSGKPAEKEKKGGGFIGFFTSIWAILLFIIVLLMIGFAINNPDAFNNLYETVKSEGEAVFSQQDDSDTGANSTADEGSNDTDANTDTGTAEVNSTEDTGSESTQAGPSTDSAMAQSEVPRWFADQVRAGVKQPREPEWLKQQRLESEKRRVAAESYQKEMQERIASGKPPVAPPWIAKQRAEAEKYHTDMQKRFANGQPAVAPPWVAQKRAEMEKRSLDRPQLATPDWIKQRRAEADKYRARMQRRPMNALPPNAPAWVKQQHAEAQKRFEEAKRQREAYWAARGYPIKP